MSEQEFSLQPLPINLDEERREKHRARSTKWREANKEKAQAKCREYYQQNKERARAQSRKYYARNKEKVKARVDAYKKVQRETNPEYLVKLRKYDKEYNARPERREAETLRNVQRKYGLSKQQFAELLQQANGRCPCCNTPFGLFGQGGPRNGESDGPVVDHDHRTDRIRGVICGRCNLLLGQAGDSPKILRLCARYLERMADLRASLDLKSSAIGRQDNA